MTAMPDHIAIVMDGNGRWAEQRKRPRNMGHQAGVKALRRTVEHCARREVRVLTVFAFSSENWHRPQQEVSRLLDLFLRSLDREVKSLHQNSFRIRFLGDRSRFQPEFTDRMSAAEEMTVNNRRMTLNVAVNYGGRWDIVQAAQNLAEQVRQGAIEPSEISDATLAEQLSTAPDPDPDLLIRTGGEMRISNFLLWQSAYTELFFTPVLWPDFGAEHLDEAIEAYASRERRFGLTGHQLRGPRLA